MDLVAYDVSTKMLAVHDGSEFLRFKLAECTLEFVKQSIKGTYFEDKYDDIIIQVPYWAGFNEVDNFRRLQAQVRKQGPKTVAELSMLMPGVDSWVKHPFRDEYAILYYVIQSLNDSHKWSREQIADWLESLDIDMRF